MRQRIISVLCKCYKLHWTICKPFSQLEMPWLAIYNKIYIKNLKRLLSLRTYNRYVIKYVKCIISQGYLTPSLCQCLHHVLVAQWTSQDNIFPPHPDYCTLLWIDWSSSPGRRRALLEPHWWNRHLAQPSSLDTPFVMSAHPRNWN